jgi:hypothetical protein
MHYSIYDSAYYVRVCIKGGGVSVCYMHYSICALIHIFFLVYFYMFVPIYFYACDIKAAGAFIYSTLLYKCPHRHPYVSSYASLYVSPYASIYMLAHIFSIYVSSHRDTSAELLLYIPATIAWASIYVSTYTGAEL